MKIYWTQKRRPNAKDANAQGQVLATNTGREGFRAVKYQDVTAQAFKEWAPLYGPVENADETVSRNHL